MHARQDDTGWLKDAIIYNILIDRFARGNGEPWLNEDANKAIFCGGNLQGIIDKLDYLKDLGINTIALTPFHPTPVYHGYHVLDFYGVDPRFGTIETVKKLLDEAHQRGIRVIMDFVLNHVSHLHPFFIDAQAHPKSKYRNWFHFTKWPKKYIAFLDYYELPKLDLLHPEVKKHIIGAALQWVDLGFDGLRLDHALGLSHAFLGELRTVMKKHNPSCMLIGEATVGRLRWRDLKTLRVRHKLWIYLLSHARINTNFFLQLQYKKDLDGVFDFFFRDMAESFFAKRRWYKSRALLHFVLTFHYRFYSDEFLPIPLLDNLDLDRFSYKLKGDTAQLKKATEFLFAQPEPVIMLYGSEAGITQREGRSHKVHDDKSHGDLEIRALMPWGSIDKEMLAFYKKLIKDHKKQSST